MELAFEHTVAPEIANVHSRSQERLRQALEYPSGASMSDLSVSAISGDRQRASLATQVRNAGDATARPLVETYIFSPDGRVVDILSEQLVLSPGQSAILREDISLPPGPHRAVSAVNTGDRIALATAATVVQAPSPQVAAGLSLVSAQLSLGQSVNAHIIITNNDTISNTGDLAVIALSSDQDNFQTWLVDLDPGASEGLTYRFVPQQEGSYRLDLRVSDGSELLARRSAAYVVGTGASLALNYSAQAFYEPGLDVTLPVTVSNGGTDESSTNFDLVTLDRLDDLAQVHNETVPLAVGAGAEVRLDATALPSAQPGLYTTQMLLDGEIHAVVDFAVTAVDTLFADIHPDAVFHDVGDVVTLTVSIMDSAFNYADAAAEVTLWRPDGITETVTIVPTATGQYEGSVTAIMTGTHIAEVAISKPAHRAVGSATYFVAGQRSSLWPTLEGWPVLGQTVPLTVTVRNERDAAIEGATLVLTSTEESLVGHSDGTGQAVLWPSATVTESYLLTLDMPGFAQTVTELAVQVISDTVPPWLYVNASAVTNVTPLTITGGTEAAAAVSVVGQPVGVGSLGRFTTTIDLVEGDNLLTVVATDPADNTTTFTQTVTLDTVPPTLTVTAPRDGLFTTSDVISVSGSTEVSASLTVNDTLVPVPSPGAFTAWTLLAQGQNVVIVISTDAAGNSVVISRTVGYSPLFADFDYDCVITVSDIMTVAAKWRCRSGDACYNENQDLDKDGDIDIVDIMLVASRWGCACGDECSYETSSSVISQREPGTPAVPVAVQLQPSSSEVVPGEVFTVVVEIEDAVNLGGFQMAMNFDPAVVQVDDATLDDFLGSTGRSTVPLGPEIDNDTGTMRFGAFSFGDLQGPDGDGALAILTLTAQETGSSQLTLENVQVADIGAQSQTVTVEAGRVIVGLPQRIHLPLIVGQ